jgi:hypothetical protein
MAILGSIVLTHPIAHGCRVSTGWIAAMVLLATVPAAHAAWSPASSGSWVVVEAWKHGLGEEHVTRVTTTLLKSVDGVPWFEHIDDKGNRWEDADAGTAEDPAASPDAAGHDSFVTRQPLALDGRMIPCRVILNERRSAPFSAGDPVSHWVARSKRWEAIDTTLRVRVLKVLDLGSETVYRDGRVEKHEGLTTQVVKTLHEPVHQHGRTYDCWVTITKTLTDDGTFAGRTTVWCSAEVPTGWVRRIRETRDPRNGAMARLQEQLVDFRLK